MINIRRRSILTAALASTLSIHVKPAGSQTGSTAKDYHKREFIHRANQRWQEEYAQALAEAKADRRRRSASLRPPGGLVPFKDWDYYYTKGQGAMWFPNKGQKYNFVTVPEGFVTDLASVPQWAWSSGIRPEGPYAYAAVVHDYLYWTQDRSRDEADEIFLFAMDDSKVDETLRDRIYKAVRLAGKPSWEKNAKLKKGGERRLLREFPSDFTISWKQWKVRPGVFAD